MLERDKPDTSLQPEEAPAPWWFERRFYSNPLPFCDCVGVEAWVFCFALLCFAFFALEETGLSFLGTTRICD